MRRYYQILGVSQNATTDEIRAAWLFSIKAFHPDKFSGSSPDQQQMAQQRTKAINEAYSVLSDPLQRSHYDREHADRPRRTEATPSGSSASPPTASTAFTKASSAAPRGDQYYNENDLRDVASLREQVRKRFWSAALLVAATATATVAIAFTIVFIVKENAPVSKPARPATNPSPRSPTSNQRQRFDPTKAIPSPIGVAPNPSVRANEPVNGLVFTNQMRNGRGTLKITNATPYPAVAKLVSSATNRAVFVVFVGAGGDYLITSIPNGNYRLAFAQGRKWNWNTKGFDEPGGSSIFRNSFDFDTTVTNEGAYYQTFEVTLQPLTGGTAGIDEVDPDLFEKF